MFYIATYATHSENYFEILKDYPDIVILGYGKKWNGFHDKVNGIINFCKSKKKNDIICFVDAFDSIILCNKDELYNKYQEFNNKLVFSRAKTPLNALSKYGFDKVFGLCNSKRLNSGMYIGTAESIIDFWSSMKKSDDDQRYATQKCNTSKYVIIDTENKLFYNYSKIDTIKYIDNRIIVNNVKPCIISAPGSNNINYILEKIGYKNIDFKYNYKYRFNTYALYFIPELFGLIIMFLLFYLMKNKSNAFLISSVLFLELVHYELYIKHCDISIYNKIFYVLIDLIHILIIIFIFYLFLNFNCNLRKLVVLNAIYIIIVLLYYYFKKKFLLIENSTITYFLDKDSIYKPFFTENKLILILIILLNLYCLFIIK